MIVSEKPYKDTTDVMIRSSGASSAVLASATALLGADLVVVTLSWDHPPSEGGIVTITFLMMISFVAFINVMHQVMRAEYLVSRIKVKGTEEKVLEKYTREMFQITKWARIMHVTVLLFTMIAFWVISYKYLISLAGYHVVILLLPFILFILYWISKFVGIEKEVGFFSSGSLMQFSIQIVFLVLICLDFFKIITIP
ncbi:MAG: hypothetical protein CEE43_05065 [Promethearchaeota archaeon Loki_b32]|nr:MAG: hypothetical protein CEE43_05065 [Candidatus Lokiarchaeota archaeon Loki_b32]